LNANFVPEISGQGGRGWESVISYQLPVAGLPVTGCQSLAEGPPNSTAESRQLFDVSTISSAKPILYRKTGNNFPCDSLSSRFFLSEPMRVSGRSSGAVRQIILLIL
jgi:hypothetical protein